MEAKLDPEQRRAATAPRGPVCIIAGAGTGKTRTITHRIAHLVDGGFVNPDHVLAVTFTARAAAELRERLMLMNIPKVQAKTFHAAARRQLAYFWRAYAGDIEWKLLDNKYALVARAARNLGVEAGKSMVADLIGEIEWAKSSLISAQDYPAHVVPQRRDCPVDPQKFVEIFRGYERLKNSPEGILLDFDDLLLHMAAALENNQGIADEFRSRYRTFVVDEYQDVTPLQQRLLDAWLGDRDDLTVVGDANQTIYSFNGATPDYLLDFSTRFPEATTVRLHRDYRSTPQVVDLANKVIGKAKGRVAGTRLELEGQRPAGPAPHFEQCADEMDEARRVAAHIKKLIADGVEPAEIAVLYRSNADSAPVEYALEQEGIGYQVKGGEGFFRRPEVREGLAALARAAQRYDPDAESVVAAVGAALVPVGLTATEPTGAKERARWQSLKALLDLVKDIAAANPELSLRSIMGLIKERVDSKNPPKVQGVTLATIHAAKGLEWDAVFLTGLAEGSLPIRYALKGAGAEDAVEEERRLFYVGITRAREHLYLSWPQARQEGGKPNRKRTRFLDGLVPGEDPLPDGAPGGGRAGRAGRAGASGAPKNACKVCGARLGSPELKILGRCGEHAPETDHVLLQDLRAWRTATAKSAGVPPYVVFTDATLLAIAETLPTSAQQLLAIPGIGPVKVESYGEDVLAITTNYA
ncbi:MAG TPA: ATP-dependent DNA helicase UvrD2 [Candidatus Corynebacterium gallistercoris]|uniref:DNA 3'-5' helicase n=1 Tax=Candidatus Corynebacterium gallistercoris TaxID=2838530 RepID=A0A9D1RXY8_9CORY|nr:ATP-dependent DNA helicase UvrD2 [Candidatus Corynebacterium gallistercoris]